MSFGKRYCRAAQRSSTNLGQFLQRLVRVVKALAHESPEVVEALVQWVQAFNLEAATDRQVAGDALVALVRKNHCQGRNPRRLYNASPCGRADD